jgi:hypothetical protein
VVIDFSYLLFSYVLYPRPESAAFCSTQWPLASLRFSPADIMMMFLSKLKDDDIMMVCLLSKSQDGSIMNMCRLYKSQDDDIMMMCLSKSQ